MFIHLKLLQASTHCDNYARALGPFTLTTQSQNNSAVCPARVQQGETLQQTGPSPVKSYRSVSRHGQCGSEHIVKLFREMNSIKSIRLINRPTFLYTYFKYPKGTFMLKEPTL